MACPYFNPAEICERELWPHRERLPLGDGFAGCCGARRTNARCDDQMLRSYCNLGYAERQAGDGGKGARDATAGCAHLPATWAATRAFDAVRFRVRRESPAVLRVQFACERAHRPALCGELRYDQSFKRWAEPPDAQLLRLAEAAVRAWVARNPQRTS